jgi:hexose-6-phosphate dehydrogenase
VSSCSGWHGNSNYKVYQLSETIDINRHTDIVLIGAQGDLSKKYLWNSIFKLYLKYSSSNSTFRFFGCGRSPPKEV